MMIRVRLGEFFYISLLLCGGTSHLRTMRQASAGYTPPGDACISYQTLYKALADFEADLHQHIHLENNILFPRAIEMERGH
jgi:regulator of cell morphogenesis and NO signaling